MSSRGTRSPAYRTDVLVVGGGLFGCALALHWAKAGRHVVLLEKAPGIVRRASRVNQARVHVGYHYPRSPLTALRSRVNRARFEEDYAPSICRGHRSLYAIARRFSKVSAAQFEAACERAGAPLCRAPSELAGLFDDSLVEAVFSVDENFVDASVLEGLLRDRLVDAGVECNLGVAAERIDGHPRGGLIVSTRSQSGAAGTVVAEQVYNCTYSALNQLLTASGLPAIALKHELSELALVRTPSALASLAVTVMCGPFFSFTPFSERGVHALSHVRYTPHRSWLDDGQQGAPDDVAGKQAFEPAAPAMLRDSARYLPAIKDCHHVESLWEVKTVLPRNEQDDGRPILFRPDHGLPGFHCVLGAKLDNVYDVIEELSLHQERRSA